MAVTPNSIITVQTPRLDVQQFSTADGASVNKTIATGATNGSKICGLWATNLDTAVHLLTLQLQRGGVSYGGCAVNIPASAGFANGTPAVNLMSTSVWPGLPTDSDGNPFFFLQSTLDLVVAQHTIALSTGIGAVINVAAARGDF